MAPVDDGKTKQKQSTVLMQIAADPLYQTRRNIFFEVLLSSYDKNTNFRPYPHFNNRK